MRPWRSSPLMGAGLAALLLAGCVQQGPPGVGVQKLAADIVFGVKPATDTPPPNLEPGQAGPGDATTYVPDTTSEAPLLDAGDTGGGNFSGPKSGRPHLPRITPLNPPKSTCPPAALTAFHRAGRHSDRAKAPGFHTARAAIRVLRP